MSSKDRLEQIITLLNERKYLSVVELSQLCQVSEMTIRRDLNRLEEEGFIRRTYGGAALGAPTDGNGSSAKNAGDAAAEKNQAGKPENILLERVDVLIAASVNPNYGSHLVEGVAKKRIPVIAESQALHSEDPVVTVDNYQAGLELGRWAGQYALDHWLGRASVLDLTYSLANTQARSRGFMAGLHEVLPEAEVALSINAQSRSATSYQLTRDALAVHPKINIIFAINDATALGAMNACTDLHIGPANLIVLPFGLEGDTMKNALAEGGYCKAGLAMFPEIVGPVCVEAAVAAFNCQLHASKLLTPHVILTPGTLSDFYTLQEGRWRLRWESVWERLKVPIDINAIQSRPGSALPGRIGFLVPFSEHEWYRSLIASMQTYASRLKIGFEVIDADQNLRDEIDNRRRLIARAAVQQIQPGDVILIDDGPIASYLAAELVNSKEITVITNAMTIFNILSQNPDIVLINTGGAYRPTSQVLVGPTAENALSELRADKLFLMVSGISLSFGLSHTNISEVTIKQTMIRSAREIILLADHASFGQESVIQVAPVTVVDKLITDDALPASVRLDLTKLGIHIVLANG
ncbi:MAG: DeoR family transcriptional regulator [Chloroflexota bacterium]|nr:MAG: DeoR family transcriptional regulator [Chloroflexota bacterium]